MANLSCKFLVIGAGPGGYVAAIRAGQLGLDTIIVDANELGGTCLNVGCIPSKALIHAADAFEEATRFTSKNPLGIRVKAPSIELSETIAWKDGVVRQLTTGVSALLKKAKVQVIEGRAHFVDGKTVRVSSRDGDVTEIKADAICIATGSAPSELPDLPFGDDVLSSTGALSLSQLPESLAVVGAGYIGLELGMAFAKLGAKVTILEMADRVLPTYGAELTKPIATRLKALGITVHLGTKATGHADGQLTAQTSDGKDIDIAAQKVLVTVGRKPVIEGWGRENLVLGMDGPFVKIDDQCRTEMAGIYAIGDVTGEPMLAHRAMAQGEMVAEIIAGEKRSWDKRVIPAICFTDPEVVSAGLSPEAAEAQGYDIISAKFPLAANGRSLSVERTDGFVRIVARKDNHAVLGIQAVGKGCAELSASFGLAIEMGARLEDIAATIHAHPTQGEALQESALLALGHALHI